MWPFDSVSCLVTVRRRPRPLCDMWPSTQPDTRLTGSRCPASSTGWVCRTNQRAVAGFFLRGFLAWKQGDPQGARELLAKALAARGPDWKPAGGTAEGDVKTSMETGRTLLSPYEKSWTGSLDDLDNVFRDLAAFIEKFRMMSPS